MSIFGLPLILFKVGDDDMGGDIEYLAIKEFDGKLRHDQGSATVTGDLATLTANTGKDMYLARAKINMTLTTLASTNIRALTVELSLDGTVIEIGIASFAENNSGNQAATYTAEYEFKNIGGKVATGEIIKLEVINIGTGISVKGFVECFEEDTGTTPKIS